MNVGFLTPEFPHPHTLPSAGIGSSVYNLARGIIERGHTVSVFVYGQKQDDIFVEGAIKIHLLTNRRKTFFNWYLNRKFIENYINKVIVQEDIQVLEAADWTGITAFMKFRCPLVIRMHGTDAYFCHLEERRQKFKNFWFEKKALHSADHLVSVSRFTAEETKKIFRLKEPVTIIHNTINTEEFEPVVGMEDSQNLLYFGSLIRKKGVLELVRAFNLLVLENSKIRLRMVGPDAIDIFTGRSTRELILETASEAALERLTIVGKVPYAEVKKEIAQAAVVVLPSFAEAFPMTWLEAMAMEKALVTSNIGWAKEIMVDQKTGFTIDPKDHGSLKKAILRLLKNSSLRTTMGKAARKHVVHNFSYDSIVEENIRFYKKVITGRP